VSRTERDGLSTTESTRGRPARESGSGGAGRSAGSGGLSRLELILLGVVALVTALAGVARYTGAVSNVAAFVLAGLGLAGGAWIVSLATEQLGQRSGPAIAGFSQSTLGNLPEFFVVIFALQAGQHIVAETAIIGSILVNALLVLGLVIVAGARRARDGVMRFSPRLPNDTATLLLLSVFIIVLIGLVVAADDPASHHVQTISIVGAIAILLVYGAWLRRYLRSDQHEPRQAPRLSLITTIALLAAAGTQSAFVSDWFVHALEPAIHTLHISQTFAGLVIVAIAGNAVENTTGIVLAAKGHSELAISVVKNSVAQIAAFLYPVLVLVSLLTAISLTFALAPVFIGALFGTAVIVWQITGDGEATVFEGLALVAVFVILAAVAAFET
jgi:Ca2+:H+ antiporter